jgi:hypothetical protein
MSRSWTSSPLPAARCIGWRRASRPSTQTPIAPKAIVLRCLLAAANVDRCFGHRVWHVERLDDEWHLHSLGPDGPRTTRAKALIVATGAQERHVPFAGWDGPGVIGLAAATILLKAQRVLPGRNVVVAGAGPLLLVVAKAIIEGGGRVAAIVDANPRTAWFAHARIFCRGRPRRARCRLGAQSCRAPACPRCTVTSSVPSMAKRPRCAPPSRSRDRDGSPRPNASTVEFACDAVCCGFGLMPATDVTRLAGASHRVRSGARRMARDRRRRPALRRAPALRRRRRRRHRGRPPRTLQGRIAALAATRDLGRDRRGHARARRMPGAHRHAQRSSAQR